MNPSHCSFVQQSAMMKDYSFRLFFSSVNFNINLGMKVDVRFSWFRNHFSKKLEELRNEHAKHPIHENVMEKLVELLTKNGADINNEVAGLGTPLAFAVRQGTLNKTIFD